MANINYQKEEQIFEDKAQVDIKISVDTTEYMKLWEEGAQKYAKKAAMPGFRKGKVPLTAVKSTYYNEISEMSYNDLVNRVVQDITQNTERKPISTIRIDFDTHEHKDGEEHSENEPIRFNLSYSYRINPKLPDLSTIKVVRESSEVSDEEVQQSMDMLLKSVNAQKSAKPADTDNSEETESETTEPTEITEWNDETVKLLGIKDINTVEELKTLIKSEVQKQKSYEQDMTYRAKILDEIVSKSVIVLPAYVLEDTMAQQERHYKERIEKLGFEYEKYIAEKNVNMDELRKEWETMIRTDLSRELILSQYVSDNKITPTEEEIDQAVQNAEKELRDRYTPEALRQYLKYVISNNIAFSKIYGEAAAEDVTEAA